MKFQFNLLLKFLLGIHYLKFSEWKKNKKNVREREKEIWHMSEWMCYVILEFIQYDFEDSKFNKMYPTFELKTLPFFILTLCWTPCLHQMVICNISRLVNDLKSGKLYLGVSGPLSVSVVENENYEFYYRKSVGIFFGNTQRARYLHTYNTKM